MPLTAEQQEDIFKEIEEKRRTEEENQKAVRKIIEQELKEKLRVFEMLLAEQYIDIDETRSYNINAEIINIENIYNRLEEKKESIDRSYHVELGVLLKKGMEQCEKHKEVSQIYLTIDDNVTEFKNIDKILQDKIKEFSHYESQVSKKRGGFRSLFGQKKEEKEKEDENEKGEKDIDIDPYLVNIMKEIKKLHDTLKNILKKIEDLVNSYGDQYKGLNGTYNKIFKHPNYNYSSFICNMKNSMDKHEKFMKENLKYLQKSDLIEGGKKSKKQPKKEILGVMRCIYKIPGDRKEYVKHKGKLITIKDFKEFMKPKKQDKPKKLTKPKKQTKAKKQTKTK